MIQSQLKPTQAPSEDIATSAMPSWNWPTAAGCA